MAILKLFDGHVWRLVIVAPGFGADIRRDLRILSLLRVLPCDVHDLSPSKKGNIYVTKFPSKKGYTCIPELLGGLTYKKKKKKILRYNNSPPYMMAAMVDSPF